MAPRQHDGAEQQSLHSGCEDRIASLDREFAVPELVGEANLPVIGVPTLGAIDRSFYFRMT
ncbi:hypothetical protein ACIDI_24c00090 [Acidiphilium sp. JA12-A1]|nr:hypothetical protein ACIDI_24c00090 [Acidiphilium sp. JA12-A1]